MPKNIIADTSCLVLLEKIKELDVLRKLFGTIVIPPTAADEFGLVLPGWIKEGYVASDSKSVPIGHYKRKWA